MSHKEALQLLFPISLEGRQLDDLTIEGDHLDAAEISANTLLVNLVPNATNEELIESWEKTMAIVPEGTLENRFAVIVAKLRARGGLSKPYFIDVAAKLGFTVEIEDFRPFECGVGMCGWPIWEEGIKWCWLVRVLNHTTVPGDFVGKTPAAYDANGDGWIWRWDAISGPMETYFQTLRKAGGLPLFVYPV